ncbi:MAG: Uma2 family endonuclease [Natronosporangium sp.]
MAQRAMYPWPAPGGDFTAEHLLDLPRDGHTYEIIDGGLHVSPPADIPHHSTADEVASALRSAAPPGWRPVRAIGVQLGASTLIPDLTVLVPSAPANAVWADPVDVALVVEVESRGSRRHDRFTKPSLYAEAGIESYWRIERTSAGPVAHLYSRASGGHYQLHRSVNPGDSYLAELPFAVQVAPATWTS